ncbi:MAG: DUF1569 domain-containing protein [Pirellulaceae bacterium]
MNEIGNRRQLDYSDWDAVLNDLHRVSAGYVQQGAWDLAQTAKHLNDWLRFPIDGFPSAPLPIRMMLGMMRLTIGRRMLRKIIAEKKMKDGAPTMPSTVYASDEESADAAVAALEHTIDRFRNHSGPIHSSPLFGPMDKATAQQLQFVHFAHHLSWLAPKQA